MAPPYSNEGFTVSIRSAEYLGGAEPGLRSALAGDVDDECRLIPILCFHAAKNDVRPFPGARRHNIGKGTADRIGNRDAVDAELLIGMVLPDMGLFEARRRRRSAP